LSAVSQKLQKEWRQAGLHALLLQLLMQARLASAIEQFGRMRGCIKDTPASTSKYHYPKSHDSSILVLYFNQLLSS